MHHVQAHQQHFSNTRSAVFQSTCWSVPTTFRPPDVSPQPHPNILILPSSQFSPSLPNLPPPLLTFRPSFCFSMSTASSPPPVILFKSSSRCASLPPLLYPRLATQPCHPLHTSPATPTKPLSNPFNFLAFPISSSPLFYTGSHHFSP